MMDVMASEWRELRSLRSNAYLLAVSLVAVLACAGVAYLMGRGFDHQTPEERLRFASNGNGLPVASFVFGTLCARQPLLHESEAPPAGHHLPGHRMTTGRAALAAPDAACRTSRRVSSSPKRYRQQRNEG
ncbi:hypothetical protein GCM10010412_008530 [Nonomuraea recticatena]|uniref:Uncharacterized protein n=1 Tax=Nonomuraea recticatena TaxID=46178 RepID=A0ABN3R8J3_9ACTN